VPNVQSIKPSAESVVNRSDHNLKVKVSNL